MAQRPAGAKNVSGNIIVCNRAYPIDARVVNWFDDPSFNAYRRACYRGPGGQPTDAVFPFSPAKGLGQMSSRLRERRLMGGSKELSRFGAHNQRSIMTVRVRYREFIWIEDLVELIEQCGSSPLYSLLKREDEKFVTEQAYENPRFVEDMVREAYSRLAAIDTITWFSVEAENFESIHNHSAYAAVELDRRD